MRDVYLVLAVFLNENNGKDEQFAEAVSCEGYIDGNVCFIDSSLSCVYNDGKFVELSQQPCVLHVISRLFFV